MRAPSPSTLHAPDLPEWHGDLSYSASTAAVLRDAYGYIHAHSNAFVAAYKGFAIAIPHVGESMCLQQRMNLHYILAQCARKMGEPVMAFEMLDRALACAAQLCDRRATAELLSLGEHETQLHAAIHRAGESARQPHVYRQSQRVEGRR